MAGEAQVVANRRNAEKPTGSRPADYAKTRSIVPPSEWWARPPYEVPEGLSGETKLIHRQAGVQTKPISSRTEPIFRGIIPCQEVGGPTMMGPLWQWIVGIIGVDDGAGSST